MSGTDQLGKLTMAADGPAAVSVNPADKAKHWHTRLAVVVFDGVMGFLLLNLLLYPVTLALRSPIRDTPLAWYGEDKILKAYPGWRREDVKALLRDTYRTPEWEPFTGFRDSPFRGKFVNVDPAGFRFSKDQAPWPPRPENFNVFVFGGSTTFGVGLPDEQTISSYSQECAPVAVYNFGRTYYLSSQELILFQQLLKAGFVPRVAVFIDGINDFGTPDGQPAFAGNFRRLMSGHLRLSALDNLPAVWVAHWLRERWSRPKSQSQETVKIDAGLLQGVADRWMANKRMIELIAAGFGVRPIFVWQPAAPYQYDLRYDPFFDSTRKFDTNAPAHVRIRYGYQLMENLRAQGKLGPNVLWLADMQQDKHQNLYVDAVHYNAAFSKEIAGQICGALTN